MRAKELKQGAVYAVKVSGAIVPCRLISGYTHDPRDGGPWTCENLKTGRRVKVRGAARFRHELELVDGKWRRLEEEPAGPLTCAACGLELERDRCVKSSHTGAAYCWPGEGCNVPQPAAVRVVDIDTRLAEADAAIATMELGPIHPAEGFADGGTPYSPEELEPLELEESGQTRIGVAGEQRALEGFAAPVKPAPLTFERDELEREAREELAWSAQIARDKAASPFFAADDYH